MVRPVSSFPGRCRDAAAKHYGTVPYVISLTLAPLAPIGP